MMLWPTNRDVDGVMRTQAVSISGLAFPAGKTDFGFMDAKWNFVSRWKIHLHFESVSSTRRSMSRERS